jgi:ribose 5-phosphate isomerase A
MGDRGMFQSKQTKEKKLLAHAALEYIQGHDIIGVGTGSTMNAFIDAMSEHNMKFEGIIASSLETEKRLKNAGFRIIDLNTIDTLPVYIDGADAFVEHGYLLKGGGGALTREKICAAAAKQFVCIADSSKRKDFLGGFPVVVEVIPMARSFVARELVKLGGNPTYRAGFKTDNGNSLLDVYDLDLIDPPKMDTLINTIAGVVCHGIFAKEHANLIITQAHGSIKTIQT